MRVNHKGRLRHLRRVAARNGVAFVEPVLFPAVGTELVLRSEVYGERYKNSKVVMMGVEAGKCLVQSKRRKSPLAVAVEHLEAA